MKITKETYVSEILKEYGDIADVIEVFGIKRVGGFGLRKFLSRFIKVKLAAKIHRVPLDKFLVMIEDAVKAVEKDGIA